MVRRGSTVRVRQRALQKRRKSDFLFRIFLHREQRALGIEPIVELSDMEGLREAPVFVSYELG
jgi:hypothetical protein